MAEEVLCRLTRSLEPDELLSARAGRLLNPWFEEVLRDGRHVDITPLLDLMREFDSRFPRIGTDQRSRPGTDRWLAPRLHWALRLTRREASDKGIWAFLTNYHFPDYVAWRWGKGDPADVNAARWCGPNHKQALARLWWSAELFRDGPDYGPVERVLVNQDFPNSYVHRVFTRSRPMALGLLTAVGEAVADKDPTSDQINDVARRVNLTLGATSIESATGFHRDDRDAYRRWLEEGPNGTEDWSSLPVGPPDGGVGQESLAQAAAVGSHICVGAGL